jgi:hypothetical protein
MRGDAPSRRIIDQSLRGRTARRSERMKDLDPAPFAGIKRW